MRYLFLVLIVTGIALSGFSESEEWNGHVYVRYTHYVGIYITKMNFFEACDIGTEYHVDAKLVSVNSEAEMLFLASMPLSESTWIGLQRNDEGVWYWLDAPIAHMFSYTNWASGYPYPNNNCGFMEEDGSWKATFHIPPSPLSICHAIYEIDPRSVPVASRSMNLGVGSWASIKASF